MTPPDRSEADALVSEVGIVQAGRRLGVAAILYTYECTIACRHCCFGCAADRPRLHMSVPQTVGHLVLLHELGRVIHIAGGECMMYWDDLQDALRAAAAAGVQPHFVETNCSFARTDAHLLERLAVLRDCGVAGLLMSADPYHQAFVPPEQFLRVRRLAREAFGPENVWCSGEPDDVIRGFADIARDEARLREHVRSSPPRMVGSAYRELRGHLDSCALADLPVEAGWRLPHDGPACGLEFDAKRMWEVHIDPYNNIQTNCGVILGNTEQISLAEAMQRGPANANIISRTLADGGPMALAELARTRHGFVPPQTATSKCDLCFTVRSFLRPFYPQILGPGEVYAV